MLGGRSLSRAAVKSSKTSILSVKYVSPARSLSSITSRPVITPSPIGQLRLQANSYLPPASVSSLSFTRFNSTSTSTSETSQTTENAASGFGDIIPKIEDIPERLGYLKELGLDFGWGPSAFMEWTIEHLHILGGMPWWASIVGAGLLVRIALFKPALMAADNAARTAPIKNQILIFRQQRLELLKQGKQLEATQVKLQTDELYKKNNIALWKSFLPLLQIPLGFGTFRVVRGMGSLPVPALTTEEFAWIHDLTTYDPTYATPLLTTAFMYLALKKGSSGGANDLSATSLGRSFIFGLPIISLLFVAWQPAALQLYFGASGLFALIQAYLLNTPLTRSWLGVAPVHKADNDVSRAMPFRMIEKIPNPSSPKESGQVTLQGGETGQTFSASPTKNISMIDKMVNNTKEGLTNMKKEMNEKVEEFRGNPSKNADGTPRAQPRLTEAEKADAKTYKSLREIDDARELELANRARLEEYQKAVGTQTAKSWQDIRMKAKAAAAPSKPSKTKTASSKSKPKSKARK